MSHIILTLTSSKKVTAYLAQSRHGFARGAAVAAAAVAAAVAVAGATAAAEDAADADAYAVALIP